MWKIPYPLIYSDVKFKHGLSSRSARTRFLVEQAIDPLALVQFEGPAVAPKYIDSLSYSKFSAIGLNFRDDRERLGGKAPAVSDTLLDKGGWLSFQGTKPEVELKVKFQQLARVIRLDVSGGKSEQRDKADSHVLWFKANFRHDISVENEDNRIGLEDSILDSWKSLLAEFVILTNTFQTVISRSWTPQT